MNKIGWITGVIAVVMVVGMIIYGFCYYTAPCSEFKTGFLRYGYAPARCVL